MSEARKLYIAADVGGTKIRTGLLDDSLTLLFTTEVASVAGEGRDALLAALASVLSHAMNQSAAQNGVLAGIGISTAGVVDSRNGRIVDATSAIPDWRGTELAAWLRERFGLPVAVENDVKAALLGELQANPALARQRVVMLTLGTGLGGAIAEHGKIVRGANSVAGHFGRMPMPNPFAGGQQVPLEFLVSGSGLANVANALSGEVVFSNGREVLESCTAGDARALAGLERFCDFLHMALEQVSWSLDPDCIVLGGGLVEARAQWWPLLEKRLAAAERPISVYPAQLNNDAGVYGAAALIRKATSADAMDELVVSAKAAEGEVYAG